MLEKKCTVYRCDASICSHTLGAVALLRKTIGSATARVYAWPFDNRLHEAQVSSAKWTRPRWRHDPNDATRRVPKRALVQRPRAHVRENASKNVQKEACIYACARSTGRCVLETPTTGWRLDSGFVPFRDAAGSVPAHTGATMAASSCRVHARLSWRARALVSFIYITRLPARSRVHLLLSADPQHVFTD